MSKALFIFKTNVFLINILRIYLLFVISNKDKHFCLPLFKLLNILDYAGLQPTVPLSEPHGL